MEKTNVFRSSKFYLWAGDVLNMRVLDETGTPITVNLVSVTTPEVPDAGTPLRPVATSALPVLTTSFNANWEVSALATKYYLDVATDVNFSSMVAGYSNKDVGNVLTYAVIGLSGSTPYYYRVRAYNTIGTSDNSNTVTTTTNLAVTDADSNNYNVVTIGNQQWLVENLKTTKYADGTPIPNLTLDADWIAEDGTAGHDGAYCYYDNNIANKADYGALYNWYAVDNAHGLAPTGWRVPTDTDFTTLVAFAGGSTVAGGKLKEQGLTHWNTPNTGATDDYGFKAMGGGFRNHIGVFESKLILGTFWKDSEALGNGLSFDLGILSAVSVNEDYAKKSGLSVRCMRDLP